VHLVSFIIRVCHDTRSPERQILSLISALVGVECQHRFTSEKETRHPLFMRLGESHRSESLPKIPPTSMRTPDRPACSESL